MARKKPPIVSSKPEEIGQEPEETGQELPEYLDYVPPAPPAMAQVSVRTTIPVENLARLAAPEPSPPVYAESHTSGAAPITPNPPPIEPLDRRTQYLENARNENKVRAYLYRLPDDKPLFNLPERLPRDKRGWVHYGSIVFDPDNYESDIQSQFPPGNYWVDIREGGQFQAKEIISVATNPLQQPKQPATASPQAPVSIMPSLEPPPIGADKQLDGVLKVAERILKLQPSVTSTPAPSLAERLEELKLLQKILTPPPPPPLPNPLEELVKVIQSDAFKQVKTMLRSPDAEPAKTTGWADLAKEAMPFLLPAVAPLLNVLAQTAARNLAQQQPAPPPRPTQPPQPPPRPTPPAPQPPPQQTAQPLPLPQQPEESEEEEMEQLNPIQQLVNDLAAQRPAAECAADIIAGIKGNLLATTQIKRLVSTDNESIWSMLVLAGGIPDEVIASIPWRDDWLNQLREELKKHFA